MIEAEKIKFEDGKLYIEDSIKVQKFWIILLIVSFMCYAISLVYQFVNQKNSPNLSDLIVGAGLLIIWITILLSFLKRSFRDQYLFSEIKKVKIQATETSVKIKILLKNSRYRKVTLTPGATAITALIDKLKRIPINVETLN